ncbi:oxidase ustYa family protein [Aspergillus melleus]|uniref:oxidase ustYa family protein n=1 Tax=Aspergillus melleus TaxID=138277 RepID=UPI001E8E965A|nr:uncharacterized protein LDX57_004999 [Aspergillus melleus]KAH8427285.1 hypothetical protein LDX57_004999 [Aspergillus melleus]
MARFFESIWTGWKGSSKSAWESDEAEDTAFLGRGTQHKSSGYGPSLAIHVRYSWPWIISTVIFACSTAILVTGGSAGQERLWRSTDLEAVKSLVSEREIRFEGALAYNDSGHLVREPSPRGDEWIGPPTPQMDALWDRVEAGSIILLDGTEADIVREKTTLFDGYWVTGLDVIHQLHCLNKVRKALYPEYYKPDQSAGTETLHVEHCFDYIRQALMCHADITPVTHTWYATAQTFGPDFGTRHMCRDFDALLQWSLARTTDAVKGKGTGGETAMDPQSVIPGSLQETGGMIHAGHGDHGAH